MNHFFAGQEQIGPDGIRITGSDYNHMKNVLRLKPGEEVSVSDGTDRVYRCEIAAYTETEALLKIVDIDGASAELPARVTLYQGIPKGEKFDLIIQKSVELGAFRIVPVAMRRCVAKIEPKKEEQKLARFRKIAESAAKQSGRNVIPEIGPVMAFSQAVEEAAASGGPILFAYEKAENPAETKAVIDALEPGQEIAVFIGPEGGFADEEAALLQEKGAKTITLGKRILRTETAPLYILSVIGYGLEFGSL